jgi:transposase
MEGGAAVFAWLGNFRRLVVRYERHAENYLGFVRLACMVILLSGICEMASSKFAL